jgi:hypothetical protein
MAMFVLFQQETVQLKRRELIASEAEQGLP